MTMSLPRPSAVGSRPAYLDNLFRDLPSTPSAHSSTSSISNSSTASNIDLRAAFHASRPLSPALEEESSDTFSIRSKKSFITSRRFRLGTILHRRTYPPGEGLERPSTSVTEPTSPPPVTVASPPPRRPSLPRLLTDFPPPRAVATYAKKPLPAVPQIPKQRPVIKRSKSTAAELSCQRCYYFAARNCNGYVLGGEAGDACEGCLQSGFFGAK